MNCFLAYFDKKWFSSKLNIWYEGASPRLPSSTNSLESVNGVIKKGHTDRKLLSLTEGLSVLSKMLGNWSENRDRDEHQFNPTLEVNDDDWDRASRFSKTWSLSQIVRTTKFLLCHPDDCEYVAAFEQHFLKKTATSTNFDSATSLLRKVFLVTLDKSNWSLSFCTCFYFHKLYMCSHIIAVAIHQKLARIPQHIVERQRIGEKPGPGRKKLAGSAWSNE